MDRHQRVLRQVMPARVETMPNAENLSEKSKESTRIEILETSPELTQIQQRRHRSRVRRQARYTEVHQLKQEGLTERAIGRKLKMSRHTVRRFLAADDFPERAQPAQKASILDPYVPYLEEQLRAGHADGTALWREIRAKGFHSCQRVSLFAPLGLALGCSPSQSGACESFCTEKQEDWWTTTACQECDSFASRSTSVRAACCMVGGTSSGRFG